MKCRILSTKPLVPRVTCHVSHVLRLCVLCTSHMSSPSQLRPKLSYWPSELHGRRHTCLFFVEARLLRKRRTWPGGYIVILTFDVKFHEMFWQSQAFTALCHVSHVLWLCVPGTYHMSSPSQLRPESYYGAGGKMFHSLKHGMTAPIVNCLINKL